MYEIDEIFPVISRAAEVAGTRYGADPQADVRLRVVGDHVRSALMLMTDGVTPGNEGRGYVLRRLLRRSIRSMRLLGVHDPVLPELLPVSKDLMSASYGDVVSQWPRVSSVAYAEEESFRRTLVAGTQIFDLAAGQARAEHRTDITADRAFALHDTYGFPFDLTLEMAAEQGLEVDQAGFRKLMQEQKDRAKADAKAKKGATVATEAYRTLRADGEVPFLGFTDLTSPAKVRGIIADGQLVDRALPGDVEENVI
jgi:alanyl-tRNA synthetase